MKKFFLFFALSLFLAINMCSAQNGIITTFAGTGTSGYSGDGGPANMAGIGINIGGTTFDNAGNLYFADQGYHVVRKINTAGIITTIAGNGIMGYSGDGGPAIAAEINPSDIAIDALGNIYIAEGSNNVVRKINTAGIISTYAGSGISGYSGDGGPATAAQMSQVLGVAVDATGNLYLSEYWSHVIRKVSPSGIITTIAGNGSYGYSGDGGTATAAKLNGPIGVKIDAMGNVYIADRGNSVVRKVNTTGVITTFAGNGVAGFSGDGGPATSAGLSAPFYLAIDGMSDIFVSDAGNWRVRKVNATGIISTVAGGGAASCVVYVGGPAINSGASPVGIAFDQAQSLYIAGGCNYIFKVQSIADIASDSFSVNINKLCNGLDITAFAYSSSPLNLKISFGDNTSSLNPLVATVPGFESVNLIHSYTHPGAYTIKMVLLNGTTPIDSATWSYNCLLCNTFPVKFYYDANGNCIKDNAEPYFCAPVTVEVDSNGIAIDTISATSGFDYTAYGNPGDIYSFRVLSLPAGIVATCSAGGMITDTLQMGMFNNYTKNLALSCSSSPGFDLAELVYTNAGRHAFAGDVLINNAYCTPQTATFTANFSPKYNFASAFPVPTSVSGNTLTWILSGVSIAGQQPHIHFTCEVPGTLLTPGDTVNSNYTVTPVSGDMIPANNTCEEIDTVRSSFDPNEMSVIPEGYIYSGTQLKYTIDFENTGNDTAQNIYVMDTLSDYVIPSSLRILASSAVMNTIPIRAGGHYIMKFDFPGIKLLDSTHHNQCNGMVMFTINTRPDLPDGTEIFNHAGIFFDDNPVVMTNYVENIIGIPSSIGVISKPLNVQLYPNPATDEITINMDKDAYSSFIITSSIGQQLIQQSLTTAQTKVNVKMLPVGLYYITLRGERGTKTQKFVKM